MNRFWIGEPATRNAKPPPEEWPISVSGAIGTGLAHYADEIREIILELAEIADVAARARGAVAADIDRIGLDAALRPSALDSAWMPRRSIRRSHAPRSPTRPVAGARAG